LAALLGVLLVGALGAPNWNEPKSAFAPLYAYSPYFTADGSNLFNQTQLLYNSRTSVWPRGLTTQIPSSLAFIANKGGLVSESTGLNLVADSCFTANIDVG
jgi:hypothetical protein